MRVVCIVLLNIFVYVTEGVKPKSVNLALETVLRFDKQNHDADVEVISKVQKFLDTVKNVMTDYNGGRRHNEEKLKLTDFIRESARILKTYKDDDLKDVFAIIHEELRKYHYKGCKFYELVQNNDVRRFMSNKLEQVKGTPATTLRRYLDKVVTTIEKDEFKGRDRFLVDLLNSLYSGTSDIFRKTINGLKVYRATGSGTVLSDYIAEILRTLLFDHYSNLNDNARSQVKHAVQHYWVSSNGNGNQEIIEDNEKKYQKLKLLDVKKFNEQDMRQWSKYVIHKHRATPPKKISQKGFKVSGVTLKIASQTISKSTGRSLIVTHDIQSKIHKKKSKRTEYRDKENKGHKKFKIDPTPQSVSSVYPLFLKPEEVKKLKKNRDHSKKQSKNKHKEIGVTRLKDIPVDTDSNTFEMVIKNIKHKKQYKGKGKVNTENGKGSEISNSIENMPMDTFKKTKLKITKKVPISKGIDVTNYYGHAVISGEGFITDESLSLGDMRKNSLSIEHNPSIENRIKENVVFDQNSIGLLTGGQNIENMNYRSKKFQRKHEKLRNPNTRKVHEKKVNDSAKPEEILAEHSAVIDVKLPIRNWKFITPEMSSVKTEFKPLRVPIKQVKPHKHHRQRQSKKINTKTKKVNFETSDDIETRKSFIAVDKLASNEGMTIESFENKDTNRIPIKKTYNHQYKKEASNETSVKIESLFNKLELQLKSVQKQIELLQNSGVSQTTTAKRVNNLNPTFRAVSMPEEETTTTDTRINSKSTTTPVVPIKTTTDFEVTTNATVSTTMATSVEIESVTATSTTATSTTSTFESGAIFRSQDHVETSSNNDTAFEETVDTIKGTTGFSITARELTGTTIINNPFKIANSVDFKELKADKLSTTEDSKLILNEMIQENPSLNRLKDLPLYSENEINATHISSKEIKTETTTNHLLNELKERIQSIVHNPDVSFTFNSNSNSKSLTDLPLRESQLQKMPRNSKEKLNTTTIDESTDKNDWIK